MDAFKAQEIERMRLGGNKPWRDFFEEHESNKMAGIRSVFLPRLCKSGRWARKWGQGACECGCQLGC